MKKIIIWALVYFTVGAVLSWVSYRMLVKRFGEKEMFGVSIIVFSCFVAWPIVFPDVMKSINED